MNNDCIEQLLAFAKTIEKFKQVERKVYHLDGRPENDAEHSWHLGMLVLLLDKDLPPEADRLTMLKLALIHDLPEIICGDTYAFDKKAQEGKKERERAAAYQLFEQLPQDLREEFTTLFVAYQDGSTIEARLVKAIDKIQPTIQNLCTDGLGWKTNKTTYEEIDNYKRPLMTDPCLKSLYERIMNEAKEKGLLK